MILFPVVVFTMSPVKFKLWIWIKWGYLIALALAVLFCLSSNLEFISNHHVDGRSFSIFISHIRFGLMLNLGVALSIQMTFEKELKWFTSALLCALFISFMLITQSMTALVLMLILSIYILLYSVKKKLKTNTRKVLIGIAGIGLVSASLFIAHVVHVRYKINTPPLRDSSLSCEENIHFFENGHRVYCNYNDISLEEAWNKRSDLKYRSLNSDGGGMRSTILRYLSSKGDVKTGAQIDALEDSEIELIENGQTSSVRYNFLHQRIDQLLFEYDAICSGSNPSGKSFAQRFEFWRIAGKIIKDNPILGVGTGDVQKEFDAEYERSNSRLSKEFRLRAHNQFLTFWIAFGILGLAVLPCSLWICFKNRGHNNTLVSTAFLIIVFLSFLTEDTLETQAGVSFFSVWISLFFLLPKVFPQTD